MAESAPDATPFTNLDPALARSLETRGFTALTPVQEAVLDPALLGRDLRISSQTGSGKTLALGLAIFPEVRASSAERASAPADSGKTAARPVALVIVPTRELAKQVEGELEWLYAELRLRLVCVTGGAGYRDELRALRREPSVVVGTPGRLLDHLKRGSIDASGVAAVVLDEADRMLDLGFRDDLEAILAETSAERRTHLVSATFPREVEALANAVQNRPARVQGTPLGTANADIEHVVHLVRPDERLAAMINLLLAGDEPRAQTLIFARTRADVADVTEALRSAGFAVGMLSGEMDQPERHRALGAFKAGTFDALVATDVAARGIDVQDIARVIHADPPEAPDAYTHRSGRTGRAGRKGTSVVLASPRELVRTVRMLARAGVKYRVASVPTREEITQARQDRLVAELTAAGDESELAADVAPLARRLAEAPNPSVVIGRLLGRLRSSQGPSPRDVTRIEPPARTRVPPPPPSRARVGARGAAGEERRDPSGSWIPFRVTWGHAHGADSRRVVAMLCRRGRIEGRDIGGIRVERTHTLVEIASGVADAFERATQGRDPRDPRVRVVRDGASGPGAAESGPADEHRGARPRAPRIVSKGREPHRPGAGRAGPRVQDRQPRDR